MNYNTDNKNVVGGGYKAFTKKLFSIKNIYKYDNYGMLQYLYKKICILGFQIYVKMKRTQYERYLFDKLQPLVMSSILNDLNYVTGNSEIQATIESDKPQDKLIVENLYKNLDEKAKNNLDKILKRNARVVNYTENLSKFPKADEIYSKEELEELQKSIQLKKEVRVLENYFQLKDYILPVNWFEPSVFLYKHGIDSINNKDLIKGAIIDAGANIGDSAIVFSKNFPNNKIISFEPIEKNYKLCQKTMMLNKVDNVIIENMGLGNEDKVSYIVSMGVLGTGSQVADNGSEKIKMTTLDKYVKENNIQVGLIKTDVEGFEPNLLRGAQETLRTQAPVLLISIYHNCSDFFKIKPMIEEIMKTSKYKYRYDFFQPVYNATIAECLLICERI